jgi:hypothetical protein
MPSGKSVASKVVDSSLVPKTERVIDKNKVTSKRIKGLILYFITVYLP